MDFATDEMNGVLVFRPPICTGEREQMFLVSPSCFLCSLPSPDSAAGSISVPTLRLSPTQCLSQHRPWWEECQQVTERLTLFFPFVWVTVAAYWVP